tara:strand:+ start:675 stop:941 length:267 start_codon:yes stop_codon:yes gene_type:complete
MTDAMIMGLMFSVIQGAFWLWIRTSISKIESLYTRIEKDKNDFIAFKLLVSDNYVKQVHLAAHMDRIDKTLDEIKSIVTKLSERRNQE